MKSRKYVTKTVCTFGLVGCAFLSVPVALAADSGWLLGGNIGQSSAEIDEARIRAQLQGDGLSTSAFSSDDTDIAFKIFGGYKFNKYFALEGGYFNLGRFGYTATTTPAGTQSGSIKLQGVNFDAVGILPFTEKFSAFGRIGANYAEAKDSFTSTGAVPLPSDPSPSETGLNYKLGVGLQYDITKKVGLRGEWERYRINDAVGNDGDINMLSLGVVVMFGGQPAPAPAPRAVAPAPAPRVVAPAPAPARATDIYCSVLDLTYEINAEEIQRDDKEKLAVLVTFLKKYPETTAVIEGHTDNVGTSENNKKLSQRRAQSVVDYLVNDNKIDPARLKAVGHGEERPIGDNATEIGKRQNRRINAVISCATDFEGLKVVTARTVVAMEMEFDGQSNAIKPEYREQLRRVANFMKANPTVTATVEGHASKYIGTKEITPKVSMEVSQRRAQNVVNHLVDDYGVARSRLSTAAFGQTRRTNYGGTASGREENRRVVIVFNYAKK